MPAQTAGVSNSGRIGTGNQGLRLAILGAGPKGIPGTGRPKFGTPGERFHRGKSKHLTSYYFHWPLNPRNKNGGIKSLTWKHAFKNQQVTHN